ncbi:hypothetical protein [Streptomyces diastatochromogenes]|uniref:Uncharacterized protein n=1 Tax=Streptomyces diastatochromogenes TaxID=42236 RepID=A0A233RSM0_STRDA|nr:hypothetical protein [Streptomyces diastatochromogenes]MCZ0984764.1 hypothetical protein [Streptomyces diastatochromogenes]OXY86387.1 hypothetical protein BEK98_44710 [Streptomyces diastatochromogenes]
MREIAEAALRFPTVTFTAVLVLVIGFWALILLDPSTRDRAVHRMDADPSQPFGTPVIAAASLVITLAWILSLGGSLLLRPHETPQPWGTALAVLLLVTSLALATLATRLATRTWRRLHR